MKLNLATLLLVTTLCSWSASTLRAGSKDDVAPTVNPPPSNNVPISQEFVSEVSYSGQANTKQGNASLGDVSNIHSHVNYIISPQIKDGVLLRVGVDTERNSLGLFNNAPLPNTLQGVNAIVGADIAVKDKILLRAELHPGIFSDFVNVTGSDFDMPFQAGGTYLWSKDFQIIFGMQVDLKSSYPVIAFPGFRWQFAPDWVLAAFPPKPQLQYKLNSAITLYTGAEFFGGTYHLNDNFGTNHGHGPTSGNSNLDGNIADFTEIRVGAGVTWKFLPNLSLDASGGYMPYRNINIHPDHVGFDAPSTSFHTSIGDGAPYCELGVTGSF